LSNSHPKQIEQLFGERACQIVVRLTKKPKDGYDKRLLKYGAWPELMVKLCDRLHNLRTMGEGTNPEWRCKQYLETRDVYLPIFERLLVEAPARYRSTITIALQEVKQYVEHGLAD
jgi:(p)ppGpp synthase/HD superfamily hydrolase